MTEAEEKERREDLRDGEEEAVGAQTSDPIDSDNPEENSGQNAEEADVSKQSKGKKRKEKKPRVKGRFPVWKRIIVFLVGFLVGIVGCLGGIVGVGFWAYGTVSLNYLEGLGIHINLPEKLQGTGEVNIRDYTLSDLLADVTYYTNASNSASLTLENLEERYGLVLLTEVREMLPEELTSLPLGELATEEGMEELLSELDIAFVLSFVGEGVLPLPLEEALGDKSLSLVTSMDFAALLEDVELGYLLSLDYRKEGSDWVLYPADPESPTLMEHMAGIKLGALMAAAEGEGDMMLLIKETLEGVTLGELLGDPDSPIGGTLISDAIVRDPATGNYGLSLDGVMGELLLGDLAGYRKSLNSWVDQNGKAAPAILEGILDYTVKDLTDGTLSLEDAIGDLRIGNLMEYEENAQGGFSDENGPLKGINKTVAELCIGDIISGDLDLGSLLNDEKVGTLLQYDLVDGDWVDQSGVPVTGMNASLANITVGEILDGTVTLDGVLGDVYLGEIMGYTVSAYESDGITPKAWVTKNGTPVEGINETVANMQAGALTDGSFDFKDAFGDQMVGELQGFTYRNGKWYRDSAATDPLSTLDNAIANLNVGDLIDGNVDLADAFGDEKIGNLQGYSYYRGTWYYDSRHQRPLPTLEGLIADWYLGDVMDGSLDVKEALGGVKTGELLGYTYQNGSWLDENGAKPSALLSLIADQTVDSLETSVEQWKLGELMGLTYENGKWLDENGEEDGLLSALADLALSEITEPDGVREVIEGLSVADALGFTYRNGSYYQGSSPVDGVLAYLADAPLGELASKTDSMKLSDVFGYQKTATGWRDAQGNPLSSLMASLADTSVVELDDRISTLSLGELFSADSGFLSLLGADTRITELDARIDSLFDPQTGATIGDFMDAGIINDVSQAQDTVLKARLGTDWRNQSMTGFVNALISLIAAV